MIMKILIGIVAVFVFAIVAGTIIGNTPEGKERQAQKDKIEKCWEIQSKKSLDPSTARFAAGMCEKMEDEYLKKWGTKP